MDGVSSQPRRERLLVVGVDRPVGAGLALALAGGWDVLGLYARTAVALDGCAAAAWSEGDGAGLARQVRDFAPRRIVCVGPAASASWDDPCEIDDIERELDCAGRLADAAAAVGARLTAISSDAVFCGPRIFHAETSPATSPAPFAQAARRLEDAWLGRGALLVRTCAYAWAPPGVEPGFAQRAWESLSEGAAANADPHRCATPILAADLAELLGRAHRRGLAGLHHIAGAERVSHYRFTAELAAAFGLPCRPLPFEGHGQPAGADTSLDSRRAARRLGRPAPMLRDGLRRFAEQARLGFREQMRAAARSFAA